MKLIDADELMEKIHSVKYLRKIKSKQLIDECERVDAIPIMWIYKYINENYEKYTISSFYGIRNEFELRAKAKELYIDLINDWRKENESNISN